MGTNWKKAPLTDYSIARISLAEGGYNYYCYIHSQGQIIIQRGNVAETEYKYADGGIRDNLDSIWVQRTGLTYVDRDEI